MNISPVILELFYKHYTYLEGVGNDPNPIISDNVILEEDVDNFSKELLTVYTDYLLNNGYTDSDVYCEPPSAIDRFLNDKLNK